MATEAQIAANRQNATKSTGPRTAPGKAASSGNSYKHGMTAEVVLGAARAEVYEARRTALRAETRPAGDIAACALDRAVSASIRLDQCGDAFDALTTRHVARARLTWDHDRRAEAAKLAEGLARRPRLIARGLETTRHGAEILIEGWVALASAIDAKGDWSEAETSRALDLLGIASEDRLGRTRLDVPEGTSPADHRREVALAEAGRLRRLKTTALDEVDELDRLQAERALLIVLDPSARLILRYEKEAYQRLERSLALARSTPSGDTAPNTARPADHEAPLELSPETLLEYESPEQASRRESDERQIAMLRAALDERSRAAQSSDDDDDTDTTPAPAPLSLRDMPTESATGRKISRHERRAMLAKARKGG